MKDEIEIEIVVGKLGKLLTELILVVNKLNEIIKSLKE